MTLTHALYGHEVKPLPPLGRDLTFNTGCMADLIRAYLDCEEGLRQRVDLVIELAIWKLSAFLEKRVELG